MSPAISLSTRFCAAVGLNGSTCLIFSRARALSSKAMPFDAARFAALEREAAFEKEKLFDDQAELRRRAEGFEQAQVRPVRREMRVAQRPAALGQPQPRANARPAAGRARSGKPSSARCDQAAQHARVDLADRLVNRNDAPQMQLRLGVVLAAQDLVLGVHHRDFLAVGVPLDFAEERNFAGRARGSTAGSRRETTCRPAGGPSRR